jgi:hypothetical protein
MIHIILDYMLRLYSVFMNVDGRLLLGQVLFFAEAMHSIYSGLGWLVPHISNIMVTSIRCHYHSRTPTRPHLPADHYHACRLVIKLIQ